jgi:hypothetical protein
MQVVAVAVALIQKAYTVQLAAQAVVAEVLVQH